MTRPNAAGTMATALALLVLYSTVAAARGYLSLPALCIRLSDQVRAHPAAVAVAAGGSLTLLALLAVASAVTRLRRTAAAVRSLMGGGRMPLPLRLDALAKRLDIAGRIDLAAIDEFVACCYGMRRPRLVLSSALVDAMADDELEAIVRHEAAHLRRRDPLRILAARALSTPLAFIPLAPAMLDAYICRRELEADRESADAMGDVVPLASALQRLLSSRNRPDLEGLAVGAISATDRRIDQLMGVRARLADLVEPPARIHAVLFSAGAVLFACGLLASAQVAGGARLCVPC